MSHRSFCLFVGVLVCATGDISFVQTGESALALYAIGILSGLMLAKIKYKSEVCSEEETEDGSLLATYQPPSVATTNTSFDYSMAAFLAPNPSRNIPGDVVEVSMGSKLQPTFFFPNGSLYTPPPVLPQQHSPLVASPPPPPPSAIEVPGLPPLDTATTATGTGGGELSTPLIAIATATPPNSLEITQCSEEGWERLGFSECDDNSSEGSPI